MNNRFTPPSDEELAARGLNPDGTPIKKAAPKPVAKKTPTKEEKD
tara:strand:- start:517 stop:651 length:135 start_codon:yes stop_codon:yes gene_type:complete